MAKMIIMKGLPACGKSTAAAVLVQDMGNTVRLNKDLLRTMLHFDKFTGINEGHTRDAARTLASTFLKKGINVIIDDTNLNEGTVQSWKDLAKEHGAPIQYVDLTGIPVGICIERDAIREKKVGKHVIMQMALQHLGHMKGEKVVICDLDGTLANIEHRLAFVKGDGKKDWKAFFEAIPQDMLRMEVAAHVRKVMEDTGAKLILVSARPDTYRPATELWLHENVPLKYEVLIMRDARDKRPDTEVKADLYDKYLKHMDIQVIFDDRPSVIRMWKEKGLPVVDVGQGIEF